MFLIEFVVGILLRYGYLFFFLKFLKNINYFEVCGGRIFLLFMYVKFNFVFFDIDYILGYLGNEKRKYFLFD